MAPRSRCKSLPRPDHVSPSQCVANESRDSYIHHIAADRGVVVPLCSDPFATHVRKNQALVLTQTFWLYAIEYSGLDKPVVHRVNVLDGLNRPGFRHSHPALHPALRPAFQAGAFIDPCDPRRYFVAILGAQRLDIARPDRCGTVSKSYGNHLIVREFHGPTPVATYERDLWKPRFAGLIRGEVWNDFVARYGAVTLTPTLGPLLGVEADGHGTFSITGLDIRCSDVAAAGLPGPVNIGAKYRLLVTFNTISKQFGEQRYLGESGFFHPLLHPPWNQMYFTPRQMSGEAVNIAVLDEVESKSWRSARRERKYSLTRSEYGAVDEPPQAPEWLDELDDGAQSPDGVQGVPDEGTEALDDLHEMSDTSSAGWETLSEEHRWAPEADSMVDADVWQDSDFFVFHNRDTEKCVVWDFREEVRESLASKEGA